MGLQGKVALITGGTSGIGAGTVRHFRREGVEVVFTGSNESAARIICAETGAHFVPQRVEDPDSWPPVMDFIAQTFRRLDIAFANAGTEKGDGDIEHVSFEGWQSILAVNLTGVMLTVQHAVRMMRTNPDGPKGSIILNSSMNAQRPLGNYVAYSTTKGALIALAKSTAVHCAQSKTAIRCNSIHPGLFDTPMTTGVSPNRKHVAIARAGRPEELSSLVVYLASDEASFCTGSEFICDGGELAGLAPNAFVE
jgi:NAD(P)-dependent dehydrogenase (short-subunit alcohol dehydrogenase family)